MADDAPFNATILTEGEWTTFKLFRIDTRESLLVATVRTACMRLNGMEEKMMEVMDLIVKGATEEFEGRG